MATTKGRGRGKKTIYNESDEDMDVSTSYNNTRKKDFKAFISKDTLEKCGIVLNEKQLDLHKKIRNNTITVCEGGAGVGKTITGCYSALSLLLDGKIDRIIITKPLQEAGENIGFLPGALEEKVEPYMQSYKSTFLKLISPELYAYLFGNGFIKFESIGYMRGVTFDNSIMLLDEAQNMTMKQLMLWITRIGNNSKALLMGDINQYDINKKDVKIKEFIDKILSNVEGVAHHAFTKDDVVRNSILIQIVDNYDKYISEQEELSRPQGRKQLLGE